MAQARPQKTLADYVAIAISPVLIMVLVGSLVFFLEELGYSGEFPGRLKWVLFWFVFAAVLIARIAIEEGSQYAAVYTLAFWGAVTLVVFRFVDRPIIGFLLLGVVWWCAKKLTWDCTLIDDSQDASGQGLLQITGLDDGEEAPEAVQNAHADDEESLSKPAANDEAQPEEPPSRRPHAPGLWVVYFSLAALPLFGLGQVFIPASDADRRSSAFRYLWFYVAAGLGLLLTTSFLGLRRYLRQRKLSMPAKMTGRWIGLGAMVALGILILCLLLPRPNASYSVTNLVDTISEKIGEASDYAMGSDDAGKGEGRRVGREAKEEESQKNGEGQKGNHGEQPGQTSKSDQPASGGQGKKEGSSSSKGGKKPSQGKKGDNEGQSKTSDQQKGQGEQKNQKGENKDQQANKKEPGGGQLQSEKQSDQQGSSKQQSQSSPSSSVGSSVARIVKWLIYIAFAVFVVIYVLRNWEMVAAGLSRFLSDLRDLLAGLFGRKPKERKPAEAVLEERLKQRPIKPFAEYPNPFRNGMERDMGTIELIEYTYDALQAWGAEHGCPKRPDQTPTEYVQELARHDSGLASSVRPVALLYLRAAFSTRPPGSQSHAQLKKAWSSLDGAASLSS